MVEGASLAAVTAWLRSRVDMREPISIALIAGGRSNLTYEVVDADGRSWVLRRPPLHSLLPSAHDMAREFRILSHLAESGVPVPKTVGFEPDRATLGEPFYVMEFVRGLVLRTPGDVEADLTRGARGRVGPAMVEVLAKLHSLDLDEVGLGDLGRRDQYVARQLKTWSGQLQRLRVGGARHLSVLDEVQTKLLSVIPDQQNSSIVHGDYRLDNVVISPAGEVLAVLDWELCTLGDPLADVATLAVYWIDPGDELLPLGTAATVAPGFWRREEVIADYQRRSTLDFSGFDYYLALAHWKLAIILEGVYTRSRAGAYGESDSDDWRRFETVVPDLATRARSLL